MAESTPRTWCGSSRPCAWLGTTRFSRLSKFSTMGRLDFFMSALPLCKGDKPGRKLLRFLGCCSWVQPTRPPILPDPSARNKEIFSKIRKIPVLRPGQQTSQRGHREHREKSQKPKFQVPPCRFYKKLPP